MKQTRKWLQRLFSKPGDDGAAASGLVRLDSAQVWRIAQRSRAQYLAEAVRKLSTVIRRRREAAGADSKDTEMSRFPGFRVRACRRAPE
jgi:hypothetical protein